MRAKITRYTCETCGKTEDMEGHCDDYDYWPSGWWSLRPEDSRGRPCRIYGRAVRLP